MSKYKTGDKFELEIEQVLEPVVIGEGEIYKIKGIPALTFGDRALDRLKQIKPAETEVDWSKVPVDTPILVTNKAESAWHKRYFAKYEDGVVYTWVAGGTSWSSNDSMLYWEYAKLAEVEE